MQIHRSSIVSIAVLALGAGIGAQTVQPPTAAAGYTIAPYASLPLAGVNNPTAIEVDAAGNLFVLTLGGDIFVIQDIDQDGVGETINLFYPGSLVFNFPCTGLALHQGEYFVSHQGVVSKLLDLNADLFADQKIDIVTGLPSWTDHQNNGFAFDPQGRMYFGVGSDSDASAPVHPFAAKIMQCDTNGQNLVVYASGMRNAYDIDYKAGLGLVCTENAWNTVASDPSFDEINLVVQGADYGFPVQTGNPPPGSSITGPITVLPAHSAPTGFTFDENGYFSGFENDMYVSFVAGGAAALVRVSPHQHSITGEWVSHLQPIAVGFQSIIDCKFSPLGFLFAADLATKTIYAVRPAEPAKIRITGSPQMGGSMTVDVEALQNPAEYMLIGISQFANPGYVLPDGRIYPLDIANFVFAYTTTPGNIVNIFSIPSFTDTTGRQSGVFNLPYVPYAVGMELYTAFVTISTSLVFGTVSDPLGFTLF